MHIASAVAYRIHVDPQSYHSRVAALAASSASVASPQTLGLVVHGLMGQGGGGIPATIVQNIACTAIQEASLESPEVSAERLLQKAQATLLQVSETPGRGSIGAVLALVWFVGNKVAIANSGDCRVYRQRRGEGLTLLTEDHTLAADIRRQGLTLPEGTDLAIYGNVLTRALGMPQTPSVPWDLRVESVEPGDLFFVATGGVDSALGEPLFEENLEDDEALAKALEHALDRAYPRQPEHSNAWEGAAVVLKSVRAPSLGPREKKDGAFYQSLDWFLKPNR